MTSSSLPHEKLWSLIKDIRFGMLTHRQANGRLHSCPLTTQNQTLHADAVLYFFISRSSTIALSLPHDNVINLAYVDPDEDRYVSITGTAHTVEDPAKVKELWSKMAEAWFPGGPTDPELRLLHVHVEDAEYWDVDDSKMVQLFKMAKALVTGEKPHDLGEHEVINMR